MAPLSLVLVAESRPPPVSVESFSDADAPLAPVLEMPVGVADDEA